ncbi:MAG: hypothetical protein JWM21_3493 [Acidobacteria bacterium]|nr:hypothetical protein [Acidobacteriota bacterium]
MRVRIIFLFGLALSLAACAAVQPISPGAPSRNQPPYPVLLTEKTQRNEAAAAAWGQLTNQQGISGKPPLALQPITATIQRLPENLSGPLYLPKVGTSAQMSAEETRESVRRFLTEWKTLIGAEPAQLSLVGESSGGDGSKTASYEQRPFSYPLRGDYGKVEVRFAPDRRVLSLTSTAIPESDRIQAALKTSLPTTPADGIPAKLVGRTFNYSDAAGQHTYTVTAATQVNVQQLVVYPLVLSSPGATLEFHLAWEIGLTNAPVKIIYLDALQDEVIAVSP